MIEAAMLWNEPNNLSHWDFELDPGWKRFAEMVTLAGAAVRAENRHLTRVLGRRLSCDRVTKADLQRYINARAGERYADAPIRPETSLVVSTIIRKASELSIGPDSACG